MPRIPRPNSDRRSHHAKPPAPERTARKIDKPSLPNVDAGVEWHPATVEWWEEAVCGLWASPMGRELIDSDIHGLRRLALLVDGFHTAQTLRERLALSGEIRIQSAAFGLDPTSRRRLGWRVDTTPEPALERWMRPRSA